MDDGDTMHACISKPDIDLLITNYNMQVQASCMNRKFNAIRRKHACMHALN